jgi:hypothetical protein
MLRLAELRGASETETRLAACFVGREAAADIFLGEQIEVGGQLTLKIFVEAAAREEAADAGSQDAQQRKHG